MGRGRKPTGPRHYPKRGGYYVWKDKKLYLLSKGGKDDVYGMIQAWLAYWRVVPVPLVERLRAVDWKHLDRLMDMKGNGAYFRFFPKEHPVPDTERWSWLTWYGTASEEEIREMLTEIGMTDEVIAYAMPIPD